ncbi:MAG: SIMPL domain-containing protein [Gemmatimonadota bacterium]
MRSTTNTTTAAVLPLALLGPPLLLLPLPSSADAQQPPPDIRTVAVEATGAVEWEPDQAVVHAAVETFAETADAAARENARITRSVIDALRDAGVADDRIRTLGYGVQPQYDVQRTPDGPDRRIVGYRAINTIEATIVDLERVGAVIDAAIDAGANRIAALRFELSEPEQARREALRRAVATAHADASAIAEAAGLRLGPVMRVTSADTERAPAVLARTAMPAEADVAAPTPIEPGPIRTTADVTVVYRLEPR